MAGLARRYACASFHIAQEVGKFGWVAEWLCGRLSRLDLHSAQRAFPLKSSPCKTLTRHDRMGDSTHLTGLNTVDTFRSHARRQIPTKG
jgi:hypothetical protein